MVDSAVSPDMRALIIMRLRQIEAEDDVKILFAVESGSRAWGFHSPDSDYDVRFVYARPRTWHYRLQKKRDVIEQPIDDELDLSGWELRKALSLALGSNAVISEWLQSPITYVAEPEAMAQLLNFAKRALDRRSVTWHYLAMMERQRARLNGPDGKIRIKRYFYVLRPILALRWMRLNKAATPPMDMAKLRAGCDLPSDTSAALDRLTVLKMQIREQAETHVAEFILDELITSEAALAQEWLESSAKTSPTHLWDEANALHMALSP